MPRKSEKNSIIDKLVEKYSMTLDTLKDLSLEELKDLLKTSETAEGMFSGLEPVQDKNSSIEAVASISNTTIQPKPTDVEWTKYVLTLFDNSELDKGMPKVDGLRRVAELLLGEFDILPKVEQVPNIDNGYRATMSVLLSFKNGRTVGACADVFSGNTDAEYAAHAIATAETRAEGRALRKALRLTKILAAEELYNAQKDEPNGSDKRITTSMLTSLIVLCDRLQIDLNKAVLKHFTDISIPDDLTHQQGIDLSKILGEYNRNKDTIPVEIKK